jgi:release factor glutamine methyltransferase
MSELTLVERLWEAGCVFAEDEVQLLEEAAAGDAELLEQLAVRRIDGEPLEHVVGWVEVDGHRYRVGPGVFVPRPRSEALIGAAVNVAPARDSAVTILDLCCGSGALGAAVYRRLQRPQGMSALAGSLLPHWELHAADIEPAAVACARKNLAELGGSVHEGDLFAALPETLRGRLDLIIANVPYVPTAHIELMNSEARDHEPHSALDGGDDGLDIFRRMIAQAPQWLARGGSILSEVAVHQVADALAAIDGAGLASSHHVDDEYEANVVIGTSR